MTRTVHYTGTPQERDEAALRDTLDYLGADAHSAAVEFAEAVAAGKESIDMLNRALALAGVSGYPFHAFCRRYCLAAYRAWMASDPDPVETDEQGHTIIREVRA